MKGIVAIVGGGAAGMMATIQAAKQGANVVLVEHNDALGKKLLATGNGRCNFSNINVSSAAYYGTSPEHKHFVDEAYEAFGLADTLACFVGLGLYASCEEGRIYPRSQQGAALRDLMLLHVERLQQEGHVSVLCNTDVENIHSTGDGWTLRLRSQEGSSDISAQALVLAPGGLAGPQFGSDGSVHGMLHSLGIETMPALPALVPLTVDLQGFTRLYGVRCPHCLVQLHVDGQAVAQEQGEIHWSRQALSGIPVLDLSSRANHALSQGSKVSLVLDFLPDFTREELSDICQPWSRSRSDIQQRLLAGFVHAKLATLLVEKASGQTTTPWENALVALLKSWIVPVQGSLGYAEAQATLGGVALHQVRADTMSVHGQPSLFLAGELLDVVGNCGGYNLQWAWSSGAIAGISAAKVV